MIYHGKAEEQGNSCTYQLLVGLVQYILNLFAAEAIKSKTDEYNQNEWEQTRGVQPFQGEVSTLNTHNVGYGNR